MGLIESLVPADAEVQASFERAVAEHARGVASGEIAVATQSYGGGHFEVSAKGVYYLGLDGDGNDKAPLFVCTPLHVIAKTRDMRSGAWGRLLRWKDDDDVSHQWAMPMDALQGDGADVRRELADRGVEIATTKTGRDLLSSYLQSWRVDARARCVERLGWHGPVYVLADESIGESGEMVVFQNTHCVEPALSQAGTVDDWIDSVSMLAAGNTRVVFSLSVAFAGPLAAIANVESGGFHLRGASSTGKSTAQIAACSVWGDPQEYKRSWRATDNGLESVAVLHNDGVLILDEISQCDVRVVGEVAYMLSNGQSKSRASRTGAARQVVRWRVLFLSSGEESLPAMLAKAGKRANAGQEIRLADIEADAGAGMGVVESLNGYACPAALTQAINDNAHRTYGAVGMAWIAQVVAERAKLPDFLKEGMAQFVSEVVPAGADSQVQRVARRFALVAVAGELATHYEMTGWQQGESMRAAKTCFASWLEGFGGTGNREERSILSQVRAFFEAHGSSRFEAMDATQDQRIINRAGFYRVADGGARTYYVLPESFRSEVCQGFNPKEAKAALIGAGMLLADPKNGHSMQNARLPGLGSIKVYVMRYQGGGDEC
ncbi:DUF927 domain-containing protein [Ralstonia sp.]|uniref:DUF927 domain-containing protein n=1 Tax=Ralstonia sp. TaxID=54061 RepID=UPI0031D329B8